MRLTFDAAVVKRLMMHAAGAPDHRMPYGHEDKGEPGLLLVGDEGVYLMSNGLPILANDGSTKNLVAYAHECDPTNMPFDSWWDAKQDSFGGDDGVDFIPLNDIPAHGRFEIEIGPTQFAILEILD